MRGGYFHIDIAEVQTAEGKLHLFVAIDRTSKFAVTRLFEKANRKTAWEFLEEVPAAIPYKTHAILPPSHGLQANHCQAMDNRNTITSRPMRFDLICKANGIEHRLTKPNHPLSAIANNRLPGSAWTNDQVARMNRTIKDATVIRYHMATTISCAAI